MCGIVGVLGGAWGNVDQARETVLTMAKAIEHRGPDDAGAWVDSEVRVAFGHRRLAIVDLSAAGHQPMVSAGGRYVLAYNGEIYNHQDLRAQLESVGSAPTWRGTSDTETLLACIEQWGLVPTLERAVGMFAVALWDRHERRLTLARDRFGEKPLYYGWLRGSLVFASELKAIRIFADLQLEICRAALAQYLRFMYVPAPFSIYKGIFKLEPGCLLTAEMPVAGVAPVNPIQPGQSSQGVAVHRWWSLARVVQTGAVEQFNDPKEACDELERVLTRAVSEQSLADVPLGAFLSGGVDSSTIAALMQTHTSRPIKTFTVGFDADGFDEAPYAKAVAQHLGTDHHEIRVSARDVMNVIPRLPHMYDEPFADSSQVPTHLVCLAARQHVTVALSGDAGDELFGGYNRYFWGPQIWNRIAWMPYSLRRTLGAAVMKIPVSSWDMLGTTVLSNQAIGGVARLGDKMYKLGARLKTVRNPHQLFASLVSEWENPEQVIKTLSTETIGMPYSLVDSNPATPGLETDQLRMMYIDSLTYLPDDILCKLDRAAMATGLETRVPFLDHRVAELAWRIPLSMKIKGTTGKWALRQVLYRHVPRELIDRPKAGFAVPIGAWLRGPLRQWAEELLDPARTEADGYFHSEAISTVWKEHLDGKRDWTSRLWAVLMFQSWLSVRD